MSLSPPRAPRFVLAVLLAALYSAPLAQAERNDPGSLLIFPEYDSRAGAMTFLTVTNTNGDGSAGSIRVHFNYVDEETCLKADALETLTARDTITVTTQAHAPGASRGYCFAYARATDSSAAVSFDHLIGQVLILDGTTASEYSMNALVFGSQTPEGTPTDLNGNGLRDLDGLEYGATPDRVAIPRFFGQLPPSQGGAFMHAELILVGLAGTRFETTVNFLIYNDNEEPFSGQYTFDCWERVPLLDISGVFGNQFLSASTDNDPSEILGLPAWESGWFEVDGASASSSTTTILDPAILAVLVEAQRLSSASLPFTIGSQTNGKLLSGSLSGN